VACVVSAVISISRRRRNLGKRQQGKRSGAGKWRSGGNRRRGSTGKNGGIEKPKATIGGNEKRGIGDLDAQAASGGCCERW